MIPTNSDSGSDSGSGSGSTINVNPDKIGKDRYRMQTVQCQSRKNNKTYLLNLDIIAKALDRTSTELLKWFGHQLNSQVNTKFVCLNGVHTEDTLQQEIYNYIKIYVLCSKCKNPETKLVYSKSKKLKKGCIACGELITFECIDKYEKWLRTHYSTLPTPTSQRIERTKK